MLTIKDISHAEIELYTIIAEKYKYISNSDNNYVILFIVALIIDLVQ